MVYPPSLWQCSIPQYGANRLARVHQIEGIVDAFVRQRVSDQFVGSDLAVHLPGDDLGYVTAAARAAERRALPAAACDQLKGTGFDPRRKERRR